VRTYLILFLFLGFFIFILNNKNINKDNIEDKIQTKSKYATIEMSINKSIFYKKYKGNIFYSDNSIKLKINSNKENILIGCNENFFWYTSTYDPIFYYGDIKEVNFILKEIFNPKSLISILNPKKCEEKIVGNYGEILKVEVLKDKAEIKSYKVYDNNNKLLYNVSYLEYNNNQPIKIEINYAPEDTIIKIKIISISGADDVDYSMPINDYFKKEKLSP
jgi:hypothetical protein